MPRRDRSVSSLPVSRPVLVAATGARSLGALAAGLGLLGSAAAWGQTPAAVPQAASAPSAQIPEPRSEAPPEAPSPSTHETTLRKVTVKQRRDEQGKEAYKANTTTIGKGKQELRDIPQSVTVVTEKLLDDRNIDTLKEALHQTAGITFMAAEGGEEDIRLRGFSLAQTGDIFVDGVRDPAFYERDTFNYDRLELLRGSASMLFGRGSTGGAVNQVSKLPFLDNAHEVSFTLGNHQYKRLTGDFNLQTAADAALRLGVMATKADNNGTGGSIDKQGMAGTYRWKIGSPDEFLVSLYYLNNDNGINYGMPWIKPTAASDGALSTLLPNQKASNYYGLASDYNRGTASHQTLTHVHRFSGQTQLRTTFRRGDYTRDQRASTVRLGTAALDTYSDATVFTRNSQVKVQTMQNMNLQSDLSTKFQALGIEHEVLTGVDVSQEKRWVYAQYLNNQGGLTTKPPTTAGTPFDGASVDESTRALRPSNEFVARSWGFYAQDLARVAKDWKLLGGLRYDRMKGDYTGYTIPSNAPTPVTVSSYQQGISKWSYRLGALFQPSPLQSYHFSYGTSFNTSGDTYSYSALSANTPPESSKNIEVGAKLDSEDGRVTTRLAVFKSTKYKERNTDVDSAATNYLLTGKRHSTGIELDLTGRITPAWEVYGSYMWLPIAKVDEAASLTFGNRVGDRPGLTPRHSGTVWTTYQLNEPLRMGAGVNFRTRQSPADVTLNASTTSAWNAPGYATFDLMAEYALNSRITFKANINNVADKYYADSLYRGHYVPGAGRLVQGNVTVKF